MAQALPPIRMSSSAYCRLKIAHGLVGTDRQEIPANRMKLKRGTALEPVILEELAEAGMVTEFTGSQQLEVVCGEPYRVGHLDGIVVADQVQGFDTWLEKLLPQEFLDDAAHGLSVMLEVKTMNDNSWKHFNRKGLNNHPWLSTYEYQIQSYYHCLVTPEILEMWNSEDFLDATEVGVGTGLSDSILVCGFNKSTDQFAFQYIKGDKKFFDHISGQLQEMVDWVQSGEMPAPDRDGRHFECSDCAYAYCCPAIEQLLETENEELEATELEDESAKAAEALAVAYDVAREQEKIGKARKGDIKDELVTAFGSPAKVITPSFRVNLSEVAGRTMIDDKALEELAEKFGFEIPTKQTKGYTGISVLPRYGVK